MAAANVISFDSSQPRDELILFLHDFVHDTNFFFLPHFALDGGSALICFCLVQKNLLEVTRKSAQLGVETLRKWRCRQGAIKKCTSFRVRDCEIHQEYGLKKATRCSKCIYESSDINKKKTTQNIDWNDRVAFLKKIHFSSFCHLPNERFAGYFFFLCKLDKTQ